MNYDENNNYIKKIENYKPEEVENVEFGLMHDLCHAEIQRNHCTELEPKPDQHSKTQNKKRLHTKIQQKKKIIKLVYHIPDWQI